MSSQPFSPPLPQGSEQAPDASSSTSSSSWTQTHPAGAAAGDLKLERPLHLPGPPMPASPPTTPPHVLDLDLEHQQAPSMTQQQQQQQQQTDLSSLGLLQEGQSQTLASGDGAGSGAQGMTLAARRSLYQHHQAQQRELSQQQARASGSAGPVIDLNQSPPLNPQASARPSSTYQFAFGVPHPAPRVASSSSPSSSPQSSQLSNSPNVAAGAGPDSGSLSGSDYGGYSHGAAEYASVDLSRSSSSDSIPAMSLGGGPTTTAGAHPYHRQNPLLSLRMAYKPAGSDGMPSPVLGPTHGAAAGGKRSLSDVESQSGAEDDDTAPITPKGHPLGSAASGFYDSVLRSVAHQTVQNVVNSVTNNSADNVQHAPGFEPARSFFSGFLGGGGTGIKKGMRGSEGDHRGRSMKRYGKFYKPQPSGSSVVMGPGGGGARTGDRRQSWHSTLSYLTRIPRKVRPLLLGTLIFLLTGLVMFMYANERVAGAERAAARRHVAHLQRAYIRKDWDGGVAAQHPMPHLRAQDGTVADGHRHVSDDVVLETDLAANYGGENEQQDDLIAENSIVDTLILTPRDELVGLISFLTSTSASALPRIDPSKPLDPQLILDFDHTKPTARQDMRQLESDMMALFPVILFGRMRDPHHREMMKMLSQYKIDPPPLIVEVDQRADAKTLIPLLARLLGSPQLPQLVLGGTAAGSYKEAQKALDDKTFKQWIARSGADITEKKIKKKPKYAKMAERAENERVLGPRPIGGA